LSEHLLQQRLHQQHQQYVCPSPFAGSSKSIIMKNTKKGQTIISDD
jgi:hypothetical protein